MMAVVRIWISVDGGHGSHGALPSQRYRHIDLGSHSGLFTRLYTLEAIAQIRSVLT